MFGILYGNTSTATTTMDNTFVLCRGIFAKRDGKLVSVIFLLSKSIVVQGATRTLKQAMLP